MIAVALCYLRKSIFRLKPFAKIVKHMIQPRNGFGTAIALASSIVLTVKPLQLLAHLMTNAQDNAVVLCLVLLELLKDLCHLLKLFEVHLRISHSNSANAFLILLVEYYCVFHNLHHSLMINLRQNSRYRLTIAKYLFFSHLITSGHI